MHARSGADSPSADVLAERLARAARIGVGLESCALLSDSRSGRFSVVTPEGAEVAIPDTASAKPCDPIAESPRASANKGTPRPPPRQSGLLGSFGWGMASTVSSLLWGGKKAALLDDDEPRPRPASAGAWRNPQTQNSGPQRRASEPEQSGADRSYLPQPGVSFAEGGERALPGTSVSRPHAVQDDARGMYGQRGTRPPRSSSEELPSLAQLARTAYKRPSPRLESGGEQASRATQGESPSPAQEGASASPAPSNGAAPAASDCLQNSAGRPPVESGHVGGAAAYPHQIGPGVEGLGHTAGALGHGAPLLTASAAQADALRAAVVPQEVPLPPVPPELALAGVHTAGPAGVAGGGGETDLGNVLESSVLPGATHMQAMPVPVGGFAKEVAVKPSPASTDITGGLFSL